MLRVKIAVREQDLQKVAIGQRVTITGSGFRKPSYTGVLTELASSARQQIVGTVTDTVVDAVVMFDQDQMDPSLRVGLNAKAAVRVSSTPDALVVPYECVLQDEEGNEYVYAYTAGRAVRRDIVSGEEWSTGFHVVSGLQAGDTVILDPGKIAGDGTAVVVPGGGRRMRDDTGLCCQEPFAKMVPYPPDRQWDHGGGGYGGDHFDDRLPGTHRG